MDSLWLASFSVLAVIHAILSVIAFFKINDSTGGFARYMALSGWWPLYSRDRFESGIPLVFGRLTLACLVIFGFILLL